VRALLGVIAPVVGGVFDFESLGAQCVLETLFFVPAQELKHKRAHLIVILAKVRAVPLEDQTQSHRVVLHIHTAVVLLLQERHGNDPQFFIDGFGTE
jgi:hypothetical protein